MDASTYERLIKGLCQAAGLDDDDYNEIVTGGHLSVDRHLVGLVHDEDDIRCNQLSVYVELDHVAAMSDPAFYLRLLQTNVLRRQSLKGHFGVHPETGNATYCLHIEVGPELNGTALLDLLHTQVHGAAWLLEQSRA